MKGKYIRPRKMKKFRSQLVAYWLTSTFERAKVADIGGGKGLVSYLLNKEGWDSTVFDPVKQALPTKYTDLFKKRHKISPDATVKYIDKGWEIEDAAGYDLLLGLHAHGVMMNIINAAVKYDIDFLIFPCCVIDEPIIKQPDVNWRESLYDYAESLGLKPKKVQLNFMGKNIGVYTDRHLTRKTVVPEEMKKLIIDPIIYEPWFEGE